MFWETIAVDENSLQALLREGDSLTLDDILSDPFTLQELRSGNEKLIDFVTRPENLVQMISYALCPSVSEEKEYTEQYKYAHLCSEILTVRSNDLLIDAFLNCETAKECLKTQIDSMQQMNHLVASFFMKIIIHILQKNFNLCMQLFQNTRFIDKCLTNMHLGAIGELLQSISKVPSSTDEINAMKQYLVDENISQRLADLLDPLLPVAVHENAADMYIDSIRTLRDILYSCSSKDDILHESLFTTEVVTNITNRMLTVDDKGRLNRSLVVNCSEILLCLIESNYIMYCPSHITEAESSGESLVRDTDSQKDAILLDETRIVETVVAQKSEEIIKLFIEDLENNEDSDIWVYLMRLLLSLCNTNHLPTQNLLCEGMKKSDFSKVFSFIYEYPLRSVFQRLVHKIIVYSVYSNTDGTSPPLIAYFFEDCNLIKHLINGASPPCNLPRLQFISLRSFHVYLALHIQDSFRNSPSNDFMLKYAESEEWATLSSILESFLEWNQSENDKLSTEGGCDAIGERRADYSQDNLAENMHGYENLISSKRLPAVNTDFLYRDNIDRISIEHSNFPDITVDFSENNKQAADFENLCKMKESSREIAFNDLCSMKDVGTDDWPPKKIDDDWFAQDSCSPNQSSFSSRNSFPEESKFSPSNIDWPSSNEFSPNSNSCWADFSTVKESLESENRHSSPIAVEDDWPGTDSASPPEMFQAFSVSSSNTENDF